ncbi:MULTISPECIES: hypothetical protein [unclassified Methanosarcina]|nr:MULTISPECIES: hypothetical protein [unclassified Methanosarcina]
MRENKNDRNEKRCRGEEERKKMQRRKGKEKIKENSQKAVSV